MTIEFRVMTAEDQAIREKVADASFIPARGDYGFVAEKGSDVVSAGWAAFTAEVPEVHVDVMDGFRGNGYATAILEELIPYGREAGWPGMRVLIAEDDDARRTYARQGFESTAPGEMMLHLRPPVKRLAVYCGSAAGERAVYAETARELGKFFARNGIELVYGGGSIGLMGAVADGALGAGGTVHGVITRGLMDHELGHTRLSELEVVETIGERISRMSELADGFVALPGGVGTIAELFDALTSQQLGLHQKPIVLLNVEGYWDPMVKMLGASKTEGFTQERYLDAVIVVDSTDSLIEELESWRAPGEKWQ